MSSQYYLKGGKKPLFVLLENDRQPRLTHKGKNQILILPLLLKLHHYSNQTMDKEVFLFRDVFQPVNEKK